MREKNPGLCYGIAEDLGAAPGRLGAVSFFHLTRSICSVAKDYLTFLILPSLLGLAVAYAVQEGVLALAWALALGLLGLAVVCMVAIAADLALGLLSLLAFGVRKLARLGARRA